MSEELNDYFRDYEIVQGRKKEKYNFLLHTGLFILTFATTTIAGAQWTTGRPGPYELSFLLKGLPYSLSMMFIISFHEFGHYFAARYHKIKATLPFYIPFPPIPIFLNFGTLGAVIKTKSPVYTKKAMFDIGIAGPLSGFIACLIVLVYGFTHLPDLSYLSAIHPFYFPADSGEGLSQLAFGNTLLFSLFKSIFVHGTGSFPPMTEVYRFPYLCVGWFGLFVTAMNMIPVGQLDGGHIAYTMFGEKNHFKIAVVSFSILLILGILGLLESFLNFTTYFGWVGWLFWALLLFFVIKIKHPHVPDYEELDLTRKVLGYISFLILIISFSPAPFTVVMGN